MLHLEKKIEGFDNILKQQQNLTESVRTERNFYSKNLVAAQDQINEMNRKFKLMNHSVEQLKEDLNSKDVALMKEHFDFLKVKKLLDRTFMLWNMRKCLSHARRNISQRMKKYIIRESSTWYCHVSSKDPWEGGHQSVCQHDMTQSVVTSRQITSHHSQPLHLEPCFSGHTISA